MKKQEKKAEAGQPGFDQIMHRLGGIVERLEQADLSLEDSLEQFEQGIALSRQGQGILDSAEEKVELLLKDGSRTALDAPGERVDGKETDNHR